MPDDHAAARAFVAADMKAHGDGHENHDKANPEDHVPQDQPGDEPAWSKAGQAHHPDYVFVDDAWVRVDGTDGE